MTKALSLPDYPPFLAALKARILDARTSAARAVNRELVLLYWDIGQGIVEKQRTAGWGDAVVERLAADLRAEFPDMRGFSPRNIWDMRRFCMACIDTRFLSQVVREMGRGHKSPILRQAVAELDTRSQSGLIEFVRQLVADIPWGHHLLILNRLTDPAARLYYLRATAQLGWSRNVLLNQIKAGASFPPEGHRLRTTLGTYVSQGRSLDSRSSPVRLGERVVDSQLKLRCPSSVRRWCSIERRRPPAVRGVEWSRRRCQGVARSQLGSDAEALSAATVKMTSVRGGKRSEANQTNRAAQLGHALTCS